MIAANTVYWYGGRIFVAVTTGPKNARGLVIEADGWHPMTLAHSTKLTPATYHGKPYPMRKLRGHLRRIAAATDGAQAMKNSLLTLKDESHDIAA